MVSLAVTLLFVPLGWGFAGVSGLVAVLSTGAACMLSCLLNLLLSQQQRAGNAGLLLSTGVRVGLVLTICIVAREGWPTLAVVDFHLWVVSVYLTLLAVDTTIMVRSLPLTRRIST